MRAALSASPLSPATQLQNIPGKRFGLHITRDSKETYRGSSMVRARIPVLAAGARTPRCDVFS